MFIKLHFEDGKEVYVNPDYILKMRRVIEDNTTIVSFTNDAMQHTSYVCVKETPEEIIDLIAVAPFLRSMGL